MALDLGRIKRRQVETSRKSGGRFFKCSEGRNVIRLFPFEHVVTKQDVANGFFEKEQSGKTATEIDRPVERFFPKGGRPILSGGESDPRMKKYLKFARSSNAKDKEYARTISPSLQYFMNIVNMDDAEHKVVEFAAPKTVYNAILEYILDPDFGEGVLGARGRDFIITYDPTKEGSAKYSVKIRDASKCHKLASSVADGVKDYYDPEVYSSLGDTPEVSDDEEDEVEVGDEVKEDGNTEEDDLDEDEDEEDEDDEEDEEEDEEDEEEELDEEDEEEEPVKEVVKKVKKPVKTAKVVKSKKVKRHK